MYISLYIGPVPNPGVTRCSRQSKWQPVTRSRKCSVPCCQAQPLTLDRLCFPGSPAASLDTFHGESSGGHDSEVIALLNCSSAWVRSHNYGLPEPESAALSLHSKWSWREMEVNRQCALSKSTSEYDLLTGVELIKFTSSWFFLFSHNWLLY